jgi:8-oxo-dGTP pyrophosphatase MutT (NUDIX family)
MYGEFDANSQYLADYSREKGAAARSDTLDTHGVGRPAGKASKSRQVGVGDESIQIASVAVINGNKLLMGKRNDNSKFTLPGGHLNPGEEPMDGAKRELLEEAGITPDNLYYLGAKNVVGLDGKNRMIHSFVCFGEYDTNAKKDPDQEVRKWEWVDCKNNLPEDIKKMLHSPKNITLQFLGLQNA